MSKDNRIRIRKSGDSDKVAKDMYNQGVQEGYKQGYEVGDVEGRTKGLELARMEQAKKIPPNAARDRLRVHPGAGTEDNFEYRYRVSIEHERRVDTLDTRYCLTVRPINGPNQDSLATLFSLDPTRLSMTALSEEDQVHRIVEQVYYAIVPACVLCGYMNVIPLVGAALMRTLPGSDTYGSIVDQLYDMVQSQFRLEKRKEQEAPPLANRITNVLL